MRDREIPAAAREAADRIFAVVLSSGGTVDAGPGQRFDPLGLLNPGKVL
jgi:hypothetical protein